MTWHLFGNCWQEQHPLVWTEVDVVQLINSLYDEADYPSVDYREWISHQSVELQIGDCLRNLRNEFKRNEYEVLNVWGKAELIENWDGKVESSQKAPGGYSGVTMKLSMNQKCTFTTKQVKQDNRV